MIANINRISNLPVYQFQNFNKLSDISHGITTRAGGVSNENFSSLNLSMMVNDDADKVKQNRNIVAAAFAVKPGNLKIPRQQHSNDVLVVGHNHPLDLNADALITKEKNIALAVLLADCVPVLIYDKINKVTAAIHAGWRGTVANIVVATISKMQQTFGTDPENVVAGIGPSIGPEVYEVGPEVKEAADNSLGNGHGSIEKRNGRYYFNLWKANQLQLLQCGVPSSNIEIAGICTYQNPEVFFSARKIKPVTGRFAAVIKIN
ncbi:MAG: peptidoglycan editing factor PgeF [Cyclobacteriaceae bacterium]